MTDIKALAETLSDFARRMAADTSGTNRDRIAAAQHAITLTAQLGQVANTTLADQLRDAANTHDSYAMALAAYMRLLADAIDAPRRTIQSHARAMTPTWRAPHYFKGRKFDVERHH